MLACACATPPKRADPQAKPSKGLALLLPFARLGRLVPPHSRSHGGSDIQRHQRNPEMSPSSFSLFGSRIEALTFHPFEANSFAVARPKPEEAPVMKIAFWSWLLIDVMIEYCSCRRHGDHVSTPSTRTPRSLDRR